MRKALLILIACVAAVGFVACSNESVADKVAGSYNCDVKVYSRFPVQSSYQDAYGQWRDTVIYRDTIYDYGKGDVVVSRIDDETVSVHLASSRLNIDETYDAVQVTDYHYQANMSTAKDSITILNRRYKGAFSATLSYDPKSLALSVNVKDYPYFYGRYILSFNTK